MSDIGAYWGPSEGPSVASAATLLHQTLQAVSSITGEEGSWVDQRSPSDHVESAEQVKAHLERGTNRDEVQNTPIESLGNSLTLWNTREGRDAVVVSARVGGTAPTWRGVCLVEARSPLTTDPDQALELFSEFVRLWNPRWATWTTNDIRDQGFEAGLKVREPHLGWLTWVREDQPDPFASAGTELHTGTLHRFGEQVEEITAPILLTGQN